MTVYVVKKTYVVDVPYNYYYNHYNQWAFLNDKEWERGEVDSQTGLVTMNRDYHFVSK